MICAKLADILIAWAESRPPDYTVGTPGDLYLLRHHLFKSKLLGVYVHEFRRSDDDRAQHDHPWPFITRVLRGSYFEHSAKGVRFVKEGGSIWSLNPRRAHRVELLGGRTPRRCFTLFIRGPKLREWGFHCPKGWVPWYRFVAANDKGAVGKGCDG